MRPRLETTALLHTLLGSPALTRMWHPAQMKSRMMVQVGVRFLMQVFIHFNSPLFRGLIAHLPGKSSSEEQREEPAGIQISISQSHPDA